MSGEYEKLVEKSGPPSSPDNDGGYGANGNSPPQNNGGVQYGRVSRSLNEEQVPPTEQQTGPQGRPLRNPTAVIRSDGYVELMRGRVPCPTCRGSGSIPKEQENELVALIPVRDDRLKPRRTCLYVSLAIIVCLLTAGLLIFFMFPRDVKISSNVKLLLPHNLTIDLQNKSASFFVVNPLNVTNSNYFAVKISDVTMSVVFAEKVLNTTSVTVDKSVQVRSHNSFSVPIGIEFNKKNGLAELVHDCAEPYIFYHRRIMYFSVTASYNFLGRDEEASLNMYTLVSCGNDTLSQ
ncbi:transmembrane protein 106B-like [Saccostrea echinata]|uniref:transmembrane protein 106B-like n=1 Tax=Saccostrea echinata TaxID=191078 RepID=UPI002A81CDF1|nr:transmembrane protein 106B-like [Saccostrea echinata]